MSAIEITQSNFQEEVLHAGKPVLLDFWARWCNPCRMVGPIVDEVAAQRRQILEELHLGKSQGYADIKAAQELAKKLYYGE